MSVVSHTHERPLGAGLSRSAQRKVLLWALVANAAYMVVEIVGGIMFDSLALLADAAHMASDVAALAIALGAQTLMVRPASARHTYGLQRAEVIGALLNGLILFGLSAYVVIEAINRAGDPRDVAGLGLTVVAALGLLVNAGSALAIHRRAGESLNMRGAFLHMALDTLGSVAAVAAGLAILVWDAVEADTIASIGIAALVLLSAYRLLRETLHVLLEAAPRSIEVAEVEKALQSDSGVEQVHHLHIWSIASDTPALSAHLVLEGELSLHEAQQRGDQVKVMLAARFGIRHSTLELECHPCDPE